MAKAAAHPQNPSLMIPGAIKATRIVPGRVFMNRFTGPLCGSLADSIRPPIRREYVTRAATNMVAIMVGLKIVSAKIQILFLRSGQQDHSSTANPTNEDIPFAGQNHFGSNGQKGGRHPGQDICSSTPKADGDGGENGDKGKIECKCLGILHRVPKMWPVAVPLHHAVSTHSPPPKRK